MPWTAQQQAEADAEVAAFIIEFDEKWLWLKNITTMNDALFNKFKGMMRSIFEWYEGYNESDISNKIAANNAFGIIKNDHSD